MSTLARTRCFTVDEYHRMGEAGILTEDDRVELIAGEIIERTPVGPLHAATVARLHRLFVERLGPRAVVWGQNPVRLAAEGSEPQPDLALLRPRPDHYAGALPEGADVVLLVEVMDTSAAYDRRVKLPLYARAGIAEVWLVDLDARTLEVHRAPQRGVFGETHIAEREGTLAPAAFPDVAFAVAELLG